MSDEHKIEALAVQTAAGDVYLRAVDQGRVIAHIGTAEPTDDYATAERKLAELIDWHVAVATDPAVNGGFKLVPAASAGLERFRLPVEAWQSNLDPDDDDEADAFTEADNLLSLIDSAAEAKVYQCPRCSTSMEVDPTAKPAQQPAAVDALAGLDTIAGYFQDGSAENLMVAPDDATRTWHVYVGRRHLGYGKTIRAALTAALANQEPRHDALADGDSASA